MHQVWPTAATVDEDALRALYAMPSVERPYVRTNFVSSLDGSAQGPDGRSGSLNTPTDQRLFALQRALCDVVFVGAGTVRAEGYRAVELNAEQQRVRALAGLDGVPPLAVVSRSLRLDPALADVARSGRVIVVTGAAGAAEPLAEAGIEVIRAPGPGGVDLVKALHRLGELGLRRVLCEGGPTLHRQLVAAGLVDDVCLTTVGTMVGGAGSRILHGPPVEARFGLAHLLIDDDGTLFARWQAQGG